MLYEVITRGLDEETLSRMPVSGVDSAKSLLAHVAIWDAVQAERISRVLDDRLDQIQPVGGPAEMDRRNAEIQRRYQDLSLEQAVAICLNRITSYNVCYTKLLRLNQFLA